MSGRWVATLWYLDQLGALALRSHRVQCRQTLAGSEYGLIDEGSLQPSPDFWAAVLWKRLMGAHAHKVELEPSASRLRVYCHSGAGAAEKPPPAAPPMTYLALNLGEAPAEISLPPGEYMAWVCAADLDAAVVEINGAVPEAAPDGTVAPLRGVRVDGESILCPPTAAVFARACAG